MARVGPQRHKKKLFICILRLLIMVTYRITTQYVLSGTLETQEYQILFALYSSCTSCDICDENTSWWY